MYFITSHKAQLPSEDTLFPYDSSAILNASGALILDADKT